MAFRKQRMGRKKVCYFTKNNITYIDYKDVELLKRFVSANGKIIQDYFNTCYELKDDDYVFMHHYVKLRGRLKIAQRNSGLTQDFTIHCFRHSHVSLLIELGYSALIIADRIGDTVETTLKTYSHLYPGKQVQLVNKLEEINNSTILVPSSPIEKKKP